MHLERECLAVLLHLEGTGISAGTHSPGMAIQGQKRDAQVSLTADTQGLG